MNESSTGITSRFQPTYEELKQLCFSNIFSSGKSFQPTYEELKPEKYKLHPLEKKRFQPTYEELKQKSKTSLKIDDVSFSAYL